MISQGKVWNCTAKVKHGNAVVRCGLERKRMVWQRYCNVRHSVEWLRQRYELSSIAEARRGDVRLRRGVVP